MTEVEGRVSMEALISLDDTGDSADFLRVNLKVTVQHDARAKLRATKRRFKDRRSEDTTRLSTVVKRVHLSGCPEYEHLRWDITRSAKIDVTIGEK